MAAPTATAATAATAAIAAIAPEERLLAPRVVMVLWRRELWRYLRDRSQLFGGMSRTVLWLIILGYGLGGALRDIEGYTYTQYILPGVIVLNVLFASLHVAIALVRDRELGLLRQMVISPAPIWALVLGKLLGGASIAVVQGSIPLVLAPLVGIRLSPANVLLAWAVMFALGFMLTALGTIVASRMRSLESFGGVSNGIIQPLYFLSGAIFPLRGVIGGVGFLDLPSHLREELRRLGIHAIGGGWLVQLPEWLMVIIYANPVSYGVDLLRTLLLGFNQLPLPVSVTVTAVLPIVLAGASAFSVSRMRM